MVVRIVIAVLILATVGGVALVMRRRPPEPPPRDVYPTPKQLDRADFPRPEAPWLVVLFTSRSCDSCAGLRDKAAALESDEVAVTEVEYFARPELHERYHVEAAPMTLIADADGVVRVSFVGAFAAPELWTAVAELRAS